MRGFTFFRTVLFLPQMIAGVVIAQAFVWFYAEDGPFNAALKLVAPDDWARGWLGEFGWALRAVGSIGTWVTFGLCMVLFVAGVQKIPDRRSTTPPASTAPARCASSSRSRCPACATSSSSPSC